MKKCISKIMLGFAGLFFFTALFVIGAVLTDNMFWHDMEQIVLLALIALSGLFLGMYRIIDLLEERQEKGVDNTHN